MAANLLLRNPDDQADDYPYVLRVFDNQGHHSYAIDQVEYNTDLDCRVAKLDGEVVTIFSSDLSFIVTPRKMFRGLTNIELYHEQLEEGMEVEKFRQYAQRIVDDGMKPSGGSYE